MKNNELLKKYAGISTLGTHYLNHLKPRTYENIRKYPRP